MNSSDFNIHLESFKVGRDSFGIHIFIKKTYSFENLRKLRLIAPSKLNLEPVYHEQEETYLKEDTDTYPFKPFTDVVFQGMSYPVGKVRSYMSGIQIGYHKKEFRIFGERKPWFSNGKLKFSEPEVCEPVPLTYENAYGGVDVSATENFEYPFPSVLKNAPFEIQSSDLNPFKYERNPVGKGFGLKGQVDVNRLELPNIEDPLCLLHPEELLLSDLKHWSKMPLPSGAEWVGQDWFPRVAYLGMLDLDAELAMDLEEVKKGLCDKRIAEPHDIFNLDRNYFYRIGNGASLGLQLPHIKAKTKLRLKNLIRDSKDVIITLPSESPEIQIEDVFNKGIVADFIITSVIVNGESKTIDVVWSKSVSSQVHLDQKELETKKVIIEWKS